MCWGGGACLLPFVARMSQARREHGAGMRRGTCPSAGGGACLVAPVVALPTLRLHPWWSPRLGLHGACSLRARSCGPSRTLSPMPPHPAALSSGWGALFAPPYLHPPPLGGRRCVGGVGPCRLPFVARTPQARRKHGAHTRRGTFPPAGGGLPCVSRHRPSYLACAPPGGGGVCRGGGALVVVPLLHACRRQDASTTQARGEALCCSRGGGVSPLGLPAFLHGIGSAPQVLQPLFPLGGSRQDAHGARHDAWQLSPTLPPLLLPLPSVLAWC